MRAVPDVGGTSVVNMRMRVDLPAPLGPDKAENLAVIDGEIQMIHGAKIAKPFGQVFDFYRGGRHGFPRVRST